MQNSFSLFVSVALGCLITVLGYPNGQITASCDTMLPQHGGNSPQSSAAPYTITASKTSFNPGDIITVTIQSNSGNAGFEGFLLEAVSVGGNRITGSFTTTGGDTQTLSCSVGPNSAVSHTSKTLKKSITASWTAPTGEGPVRFRATVLSSYFTFWTGVESATIVALQMSNTTCGTQKFCFTDPINCSPSDNTCLFMSSTPSSNGYVFEMSGPTTGYVAIGFSADTVMGNDDVYICTIVSSSIIVQRAYTTGKVAPTISNTNTTGSIVSSNNNGVLKCSFITQSTIALPQRSTASSSYYVFLVSGPSQTNGQILQHTKTAVSGQVDLSSFMTSAAQSTTSPLVRCHGALMLIAWMTTGSIGMIMARYMKTAAGKAFLGKALWFQTHFALMILTVVLTIIAFIIVFVEVSGWSGDTGAHPILGCIVMILSLIQPFAALFRPDPKSERRFIFNWGHSINALVIKILAVATIFLGLILLDTTSNQWFAKVMGGFFAWEVLFYIILEISIRYQPKDVYEVVEDKTHPETVSFWIFVCGNFAFLISLLVGIGNS